MGKFHVTEGDVQCDALLQGRPDGGWNCKHLNLTSVLSKVRVQIILCVITGHMPGKQRIRHSGFGKVRSIHHKAGGGAEAHVL